jgi:hypothetical protein
MSQVRHNGPGGAVEAARPIYYKVLSQYNRFKNPGTSIYNRDWELLIILDACRLDLIKEVQDSYIFLDNISTFRSLDSTTAYWMRKNFTNKYSEEMANTIYVCGNPFSESELNPGQFQRLSEVWRKAWVEPGTVPPRAITDETIRAMRQESADRVIAHYMQPHCPFIPRPELSKGKELERFGNQGWRDVWERLRVGELSYREVWEGYRLNLKLVLDDVELLLNSVDAEPVVISSDHGNSIGKWGIYGHPPNMPHDCLRNVPWIETAATDKGQYQPGTELTTEVDESREEQLDALGYVD